jgi:hypothetical protein
MGPILADMLPAWQPSPPTHGEPTGATVVGALVHYPSCQPSFFGADIVKHLEAK